MVILLEFVASIVACALAEIVIFKIAPPYKSLYGLTSVPPPASPILKGALLLNIMFNYLLCQSNIQLKTIAESNRLLFLK